MDIRDPIAHLAMHPHFEAVFDNCEAAALLKHLLLDTRFPPKPAQAVEWLSLMHFADHDTHLIVAARFEGFANAADNGDVVHCFPRSQYTHQRVEQEIAKLYGPLMRGPIRARWISSPKAQH